MLQPQIADNQIIDMLLTGSHPKSVAYQGQHVLVIGGQIVPLVDDYQTAKDYEALKQKYGRVPILVFVPRLDAF